MKFVRPALLVIGVFLASPVWTSGAHAGEPPVAHVDWQPGYRGDIFADTNSHLAAIALHRDWIVYGHNDGSQFAIGGGGPRDGLSFPTGPEKSAAVYDAVHGIAYIFRGCCTWGEEAIQYIGRPHVTLPLRDLSLIHTALGVRLGMLPAQVRRRVGAARLRQMSKSSLKELSYRVTRVPPGEDINSCGESLHYVFRDNRLVLISLTDAC